MCASETKPDAPEIVVQHLQEIGATERHFNGLQAGYRRLASTWALAALAAIGAVLLKSEAKALAPLLLPGIGVAGAAGIAVLWLLDVRVYHVLLHASFEAGLELERRHDWLPKVRTGIVNRPGMTVAKYITFFYVLASVTPLVAACALTENPDHAVWFGISVAFAAFVGAAFWVASQIRATPAATR